MKVVPLNLVPTQSNVYIDSTASQIFDLKIHLADTLEVLVRRKTGDEFLCQTRGKIFDVVYHIFVRPHSETVHISINKKDTEDFIEIS